MIKERFLSGDYQPDSYALYELRPYMPYNTSVRIMVELTEEVDGDILDVAANTAIKRYPYFSVQIEGKDGKFVLAHNSRPIAVLKTQTPTPALGSEEVNGHLTSIDYAGNTIYFNMSHSIAGAAGILPWVKSVLYQYLCKKYDVDLNPAGINLPDSDFLPGELDFPMPEDLPDVEPMGNSNPPMGYFPAEDYAAAFQNPDRSGDGYYCIQMKQSELMQYVRSNDGSPATIIAALMFKAMAPLFPAEESLITCGVACNFRDSVNCPNTYRDLSRPLHIQYKRSYLDFPVEKLGTITRGMIMLQSMPENSICETKEIIKYHEQIDTLGSIEEKQKFCLTEGRFTKGCKDTYNVSYVGTTDFGDMQQYIKAIYTIAFGHLLVEINSMGDMFFLTFHQIIDDDKYINAFLKVMDEVGLSYTISEYRQKNIAALQLP